MRVERRSHRATVAGILIGIGMGGSLNLSWFVGSEKA
jgi:hypothetical protein